jgi:electron-transferring-flavoprotein dehydrogenase
MKSGMLAADAAFAALAEAEPPAVLAAYPEAFRNSWAHTELHLARNIRPSFRFGLFGGLAYSALDAYLLRGRAPWTMHHHPDHAQLKPARAFQPIDYPKPDGKLTFDRLSSVYISNTNHDDDQPCHLRLLDPEVPVRTNLVEYAGPEQRYCPAGVYEFVQDDGQPRLQINFQNCVHCKTCDIKDPRQNIVWVVPQGGDGPNYVGM